MGIRIALLILAALLMAAHFLREGNGALVLASLLAPGWLAVRRRWVRILVQVLAYSGAGVWVHTAFVLAVFRRDAGLPWHRMALILGGVALFTALAGLLLNSREAKAWFGEEQKAGPQR